MAGDGCDPLDLPQDLLERPFRVDHASDRCPHLQLALLPQVLVGAKPSSGLAAINDARQPGHAVRALHGGQGSDHFGVAVGARLQQRRHELARSDDQPGGFAGVVPHQLSVGRIGGVGRNARQFQGRRVQHRGITVVEQDWTVAGILVNLPAIRIATLPQAGGIHLRDEDQVLASGLRFDVSTHGLETPQYGNLAIGFSQGRLDGVDMAVDQSGQHRSALQVHLARPRPGLATHDLGRADIQDAPGGDGHGFDHGALVPHGDDLAVVVERVGRPGRNLTLGRPLLRHRGRAEKQKQCGQARQRNHPPPPQGTNS